MGKLKFRLGLYNNAVGHHAIHPSFITSPTIDCKMGFRLIYPARFTLLIEKSRVGQNFTLATMDNCKKFAVIVSITTICSYINFSHSIWQRTAPKQLRARLTRTLSLVWGRTDKFCQVELNALKEKEENLLWWALRENWRSLKHFKRVIVEKNRNENI